MSLSYKKTLPNCVPESERLAMERVESLIDDNDVTVSCDRCLVITELEEIWTCSDCGKLVCNDCLVEVETDLFICKECIEENIVLNQIIQKINRAKNIVRQKLQQRYADRRAMK